MIVTATSHGNRRLTMTRTRDGLARSITGIGCLSFCHFSPYRCHSSPCRRAAAAAIGPSTRPTKLRAQRMVKGGPNGVGPTIAAFFVQAEDGIRDADVTGVQTCALPISLRYLWHCAA